MKGLVQNLGIIIFIIAVILLIIGFFQDMATNRILIISGGLIVLGLIVHVIVNKIVE